MARTSEPPIRCSFCGKRESQAGRLIAGPGVYICSDCVKACSDLLAEEMAAKKSGIPKLDSLPTPMEMKAFMDHYIIGQEEAKSPFRSPYTTTTNASITRIIPMWTCKRAIFC